MNFNLFNDFIIEFLYFISFINNSFTLLLFNNDIFIMNLIYLFYKSEIIKDKKEKHI